MTPAHPFIFLPVPNTPEWLQVAIQFNARRIESRARELCQLDAAARTTAAPGKAPCHPYRTYAEYEDARWPRFVEAALDESLAAAEAASAPQEDS